MIALLLALAPVSTCVEKLKTPEPVSCPIYPPEETFRAHVMSERLECGPITADKVCHDLAARWNDPCRGPKECGDDEAYCIWRSDGTVEAKNAVCSDRKGERTR